MIDSLMFIVIVIVWLLFASAIMYGALVLLEDVMALTTLVLVWMFSPKRSKY